MLAAPADRPRLPAGTGSRPAERPEARSPPRANRRGGERLRRPRAGRLGERTEGAEAAAHAERETRLARVTRERSLGAPAPARVERQLERARLLVPAGAGLEP